MGGKPSHDRRLVVAGLEGAGKTTMLFKLKLGTVETRASGGTVIETLRYKNVTLVSGIKKAKNTVAVIYVVDAAARRFEAARHELQELLSGEERDVAVLVYANKQDAADAASPEEVTEFLDLVRLRQRWHVQASSALAGDGLYEGLDWISSVLQHSHPRRPPVHEDDFSVGGLLGVVFRAAGLPDNTLSLVSKLAL
ncbi:hypothetical protein CTAYLR_004953 [Chrysophaeum taylorii]|uniref:Uncharacterized protein n=1 Tax=Chrysophaeum taylorii TaxID=2483200 RepID=A0AAD7XNU8_9STRA|nr:hypothetical protein CTAYLR_004953 [Chrysophaeum taylorii]